jgi:hypothetical protein
LVVTHQPVSKLLPATALSDPFLASTESESTDETIGRYSVGDFLKQTTMKLKHDDDRKARIKALKSKTEGAGKGDKPRPITSKYWDNYDDIDWKKK